MRCSLALYPICVGPQFTGNSVKGKRLSPVACEPFDESRVMIQVPFDDLSWAASWLAIAFAHTNSANCQDIVLNHILPA